MVPSHCCHVVVPNLLIRTLLESFETGLTHFKQVLEYLLCNGYKLIRTHGAKPCVFQVVREVQMRMMPHCVCKKETKVSQATDKRLHNNCS